jgi:Ca2+ transporting ATPase
VPQAIQKLKEGNVNIRMISGDHVDTAVYAAIKAGILKDVDVGKDKVVMKGEEFRRLVGPVSKIPDGLGNFTYEVTTDRDTLKMVANKLRVLARSTPEDKFALIVALKQLGATIAVTADGINDARALKEANVGFCMGISGCEVAKESSDIVILKDDFKSVFRATQWGRNVYDNIRKFIQFQITVNIVALIVVFLGGATLGSSPFNVIQLLWINMVMDTLAAIALATEPPHPAELKKEKIRKSDKVFLPVMWRTVLSQSLYQVLVMIVLLYFAPLMFPGANYDYINEEFYFTEAQAVIANDVTMIGKPTNRLIHYTFLFNTFMMMQIFNQVNCRKLGATERNIFERPLNNLAFLLILAGEVVAQWFMVEIGGIVGTIFRTTPLPFDM